MVLHLMGRHGVGDDDGFILLDVQHLNHPRLGGRESLPHDEGRLLGCCKGLFRKPSTRTTSHTCRAPNGLAQGQGQRDEVIGAPAHPSSFRAHRTGQGQQ